jgi:cytochrome c556
MRHVRTGVVIGGLAAMVLAGCATGKMQARKPEEVVADRQRLMKLHGALWKDIQKEAKAGDLEGVATGAEALALNAPRIPALFPEGSMTDKSKAKPDIWQKWPDFEKAAMTMKSESEKLRDAATKKDAAATDAIMKDFGRNACGTCHQPFRVPPPQQRS